MMNKGKVYFAAFKGRSLSSRLIKWFTRSRYSHIAYLDIDTLEKIYKITATPSVDTSFKELDVFTIKANEKILVEAWSDSYGFKDTINSYVDSRSLDQHKIFTHVDIYELEVDDAESIHHQHMYHVANKTKYNWLGILSFLTKKDHIFENKKFCSELHWDILSKQKDLKSLTQDIPGCRISPSMFVYMLVAHGAKLKYGCYAKDNGTVTFAKTNT